MPGALTVVYVEELINLILGESLRFFLMGDGGRVMPSLESCPQLASQSELALRFPIICALAVDWLAYGTEVLTSDHAYLFSTGASLPRTIVFDRRAQAMNMTTGYAFFLLRYFYNSLLPIVKKVSDCLCMCGLLVCVRELWLMAPCRICQTMSCKRRSSLSMPRAVSVMW